MRLKTGDFARARHLADSVLAAAGDTASDPTTLAGLAALRGDAPRAAAFLRRTAPSYTFTTPTGGEWSLQRPVAEPALTHLAYAAIGAPADTLRTLERATLEAIDRFATGERRDEIAVAALLRPGMLGFPVAGAAWIHGRGRQPTPLFTLQRLLLDGDTAAVREQLDALLAERAPLRPGDVSIDEIHQEAELRLAIGDTAAAAALLDRSLDALPTLGFELVRQVAEAGGLVRAMALRAQVARGTGDRRTAERWEAAVAALRSPADRARDS
jgi:hypothetical protein